MISGDIFIAKQMKARGESIILLPKEEVRYASQAQGMLAIPHLYWQNS